jgi:catechol 2,3-dioxygenase-like lactoylglutathione lyase family enzyme
MAVLDHVGVRVTDLDRAIAFYRDMFGFDLKDRRMLNSAEPVEAAMMEVGEHSVLFLLYNPEFEAFPPSVQGRPDHFCLTFEAEEFEGVMQRLEAAGHFERLDCSLSPRTGATGRSPSKYILDPDNNQIEVKVKTAVSAGTNGAVTGASSTPA